MHELPITQKVCEMVVEKAHELGAERVTQIFIKQGEYVDYVPEIIQQYFEVVSEGTIAENAKLRIETLPTRLLCRECGVQSEGLGLMMTCPKCGSAKTTLLSGKEFYIENMEIED